MNVGCSAIPCPVILDSTCVFYSGANLIYTGINTNDSIEQSLIKIDNKFRDAALGYVFQNGIIQAVPGGPVRLGGTLNEDTTIINAGYKLALTGTIESSAFITTGGTSSQFVKGDGSFDNTAYQPVGNYITELTGDGTATGPGSVPFTLSTTGVLANVYGSSTEIPIITIDSKGRITWASSTPFTVPPALLIFSGDVTGVGYTNTTIPLTLNSVLSTPGIYGGATTIPVVTVNAKGLVTGISQVPFSSGSGTVTSVGVSPGTGISASVANPTTTPVITITNTAPDQTVVLNNGTGISVTGTYPNFTIAATGGSIPTLQQVLTAGSYVTDKSITSVSSSGYTSVYYPNLISFYNNSYIGSKANYIQIGNDNNSNQYNILWGNINSVLNIYYKTLRPLYAVDQNNSTEYLLPDTNTGLTSIILASSVNGYSADNFGNITIPVGGAQDLQSVTDIGNTTTNNIEVDYLQTNGDVFVGKLGAGGAVVIDDGLGYTGRVDAANLTTSQILSLPDVTGNLAVSVNGTAAGTDGDIILSIPTVGTWGALDYPAWTSGTPFVKMTAAGTFGLDTNTYLTSITSSDVTTALGYTPVTNARTLTINGSTQDLTADRTWSVGTVTSVGLSMPTAFSVASSPVIGSGTLAVTGAGAVSQYIRGDGSLANFPISTGGGSSVSYYLNGSVNQGVFGGATYYEINGTPVIGGGTDFTINANGYIAQFITDVADPNKLLIPAGNWNFETYFSASSAGGSPSFYIELYKYNGITFTLIASNSATPENITGGTSIDLYLTALAVPSTTLLATDRLAVRFFVTHSGRTITMHTEGSHLSQIITTFSTGLTALNGLTAQVQSFATGTSGTDFGISSSTATHTFNLPDASATNRGALSSTDWSIFNGKQAALTFSTGLTNSANTITNNLSTGVSGGQSVVGGTAASNSLTLSSTTNATKGKLLFGTSAYDEVNNRLGIGTASPVYALDVNGSVNIVSGQQLLLAGASLTPGNRFTIGNSSTYKTTNAGSNLSGLMSLIPNGGGAGQPSLIYDFQNSNGLVFGAGNGTAQIARAGINIASLTNTAGAESGDMIFLTQSSGTAMSEKVRINSIGNVLMQQNLSVNTCVKGGSSVIGSATYRLTNGGSNLTPQGTFGYPDATAAGLLSVAIDMVNNNGLMFIGSNGTANNRIPRAAINITNLNNTAGSESGDMTFLTQTGGTAMAERMRIFGGGNVAIGTTTDNGTKLYVNGTTYFNGNSTLGAVSNAVTQLNAGQASVTQVFSRSVSGGTAITPNFTAGNAAGGTAGSTGVAIDNTNQLTFITFNTGGFRTIRSAIQSVSTNNTAGSDAGDLLFLTQSGGTAASEKMRITGAGGLTINATNTASGTTGNQTINKASGTVNIAAAGTTVTVTNSLVSATSIVYAVIRTNDATATIKNVVPAAGSFVINLNAAATAEVSIGFFVIN